MTTSALTTPVAAPAPLDRWLAAWRVPGWRRRLAAWAIIGAVGDAATTSLLEVVGGVHEANPVVAAGIDAAGSAPLFMILVTIPLALGFSCIAVRPLTSAGRSALRMLAVAGAVKLAATVWNLALIDAALRASTYIVV